MFKNERRNQGIQVLQLFQALRFYTAINFINVYWNKYNTNKAMQKTAIACFRNFQQFRMLGTDFEGHLRTFLDF